MNAVLAEIHPAAHTDTHAVLEAVHIPLVRIRPSPTNPRKHFDPVALADLARSIKEHGLLQPILVRPIAPAGGVEYEIVAGERRWQASKLPEAGEPYTIMAIARAMTDFEVLEVQVIENLKRTDLHPLEEAAGYEALLRKPDGLQGYANVDELAARVGKSPSFIWQRRKLLALGPEAREAFLAGKLQVSIAILVARLQPADQAEATQAILRGWGGDSMSYKTAAEHIHRNYFLELDKAIFKITDAALVPGAGSCRDCTKRTGANPDLFDDVKKHDTCTDAKCYAAKEDAHRAQLKATAEAEGKTVITGKEAKAARPQQHGGLKGYLELDRTHYTLGDKPLRQLLGKALAKGTPETQLLEDPHTKALVEVVREADALAVLKEAGVIKTAKMPTTGAAERDADRKAKAERAWRGLVAEECVRLAAVPNAAFRAGLLWTVAAKLWGELHSDVQKLVLKLLGWPPLRSSWDHSGTHGPGITAAQHIAALNADQLAAYFVAVAIAGDTQVSNQSTERKPELLLATAAALGVDVPAIKAASKAATGEVRKTTPDKTAAERARKKAAELTPETALAGALKAAAKKAATKATTRPSIRYRDAATGSTWSGRGLQPQWLKLALASGRTLNEFDITGPGASSPVATLSAAAADPFRV